jgi:hypothetical protein
MNIQTDIFNEQEFDIPHIDTDSGHDVTIITDQREHKPLYVYSMSRVETTGFTFQLAEHDSPRVVGSMFKYELVDDVPEHYIQVKYFDENHEKLSKVEAGTSVHILCDSHDEYEGAYELVNVEQTDQYEQPNVIFHVDDEEKRLYSYEGIFKPVDE